MNDKDYLVQIQENIGSDQPLTEHVNSENAAPTRMNADEKLLYLDGLRGILCLIVVFNHCLLMGIGIHEENFSIFYRPRLHHSPFRLLVAGEFAVAGFFVLSGCVLVRRYLDKFNENKILLNGIIRRFPRLFIPSTVALLVYFSIFHFQSFYGYNLLNVMKLVKVQSIVRRFI